MTQKNFIKENFALIIGLTLPVLLMFGFMIAANLPQAAADPPKYDLVFAVTEYPNVSGGIPVAVRLVVKDGVLKADYTRNVPATPNSYPYNSWKKLYLYEAKTQKVKELTFGYPSDMDKIEGTREDTVDATKNLKLDTTLQSPDGYELTTDGYDHYGFFNEIFWGGGYTNQPVLKKGNARVKLATGDGRTSFSYTNPEFVGWVVGASP